MIQHPPFILRLPHCPEQLPEHLRKATAITLATEDGAAHPAAIQQRLNDALSTPARADIEAIVGSDQTPALWWLLAAQHQPQARHWYYAEQDWHSISAPQTGTAPTPDAIPAKAPVAPVASVAPAASVAPVAPVAPAASIAVAPAPQHGSGPFAHMTDGALIYEAFKLCAWGSDKPERQRQLEDIEQEVLTGTNRSAELHSRFRKACHRGEKACQLTKQLEQVLNQHGLEHAQQWLEHQTAQLPEKIRSHLQHQLKKQKKRHQSWQQRKAQAQYKSSVSVSLADGRHPNSLHNLPLASSWSIYIDETGQLFDERAEVLESTDKDVGRLVALAVPANVQLPPLKGFHGTEADGKQTDAVLQRLLNTPVGIFGFSVQDTSARHRYWLGHVLHLVRWVLLQLPVPAASATPPGTCQVKVFIEQHSGYTSADKLHILNQTLESEFQSIDPQRFGQLRLELAFMDKNHPCNGYVDAIAYTWGSPSGLSKDRLKKSALRGHCLVDSGERALHHLYLSLSEQRPLSPAEWYGLCTAANTDAPGGFLARKLEEAGQSLSSHPTHWAAYLNEVRHHLHTKQYQLAELSHALKWLEQWAPQGQCLPGALRLLMQSAYLASENHLGQIDPQRLSACLDLVLRLRDEVPEQACEAILRITTATTNSFEFDVLRDFIADWTSQPVGIPGLLNHGKLHSTLGQIEAFMGRPAAALAHFDQALASFARLSDAQQAQRESSQTRSYRLIAQLDALTGHAANGTATAQMLSDLQAHFGQALDKTQPEAISRSLAHSGQHHRYLHHLWLRALICLPEALAAARQAYCQAQGQWQDGEDHPWPLIAAYRGWLLHDSGQHGAAAMQWQQAIDTCDSEPHGPTLAWMAEVLRTLAQALQVALPDAAHRPGANRRAALKQALPHAPHAALAQFADAADAADAAHPLPHAQAMAHLNACLPFNFH